MNISLTNLDKGPMTAFEPDWQREAIKRAENDPEIISQAEKINSTFRARALEALGREDWIPGLAIKSILQGIPRYAYLKRISDGESHEYDAEIDLLFQTISFAMVD